MGNCHQPLTQTRRHGSSYHAQAVQLIMYCRLLIEELENFDELRRLIQESQVDPQEPWLFTIVLAERALENATMTRQQCLEIDGFFDEATDALVGCSFRHTSNIRNGMSAARKRDDEAFHERGKLVNSRKGQKAGAATVSIEVWIRSKSLDSENQFICAAEKFNPEDYLEDILWWLFQKGRISIRQNPHFYLPLPPEHACRDPVHPLPFTQALQEIIPSNRQHKLVLWLFTDRECHIYLRCQRPQRILSNIGHINGVLVLKDRLGIVEAAENFEDVVEGDMNYWKRTRSLSSPGFQLAKGTTQYGWAKLLEETSKRPYVDWLIEPIPDHAPPRNGPQASSSTTNASLQIRVESKVAPVDYVL